MAIFLQLKNMFVQCLFCIFSPCFYISSNQNTSLSSIITRIVSLYQEAEAHVACLVVTSYLTINWPASSPNVGIPVYSPAVNQQAYYLMLCLMVTNTSRYSAEEQLT